MSFHIKLPGAANITTEKYLSFEEGVAAAVARSPDFPGEQVEVYELRRVATAEVPEKPEPVVTYERITDDPNVVRPRAELEAIAEAMAKGAAEEERLDARRRPGPTRGPRREAA